MHVTNATLQVTIREATATISVVYSLGSSVCRWMFGQVNAPYHLRHHAIYSLQSRNLFQLMCAVTGTLKGTINLSSAAICTVVPA